MSKLEQLINELCPDGVEYKCLWEVTTWDKKFNSVSKNKQTKVITYPYMLAAELFKLEVVNGTVFLLSTGEKTGWTDEITAGKNLCEGEVITIPWGKSRPVKEVMKYYKGKFVTADNRIATSSNTDILSNKYLYYCMVNSSELIDRTYRGSGIKHPNMNEVLHIAIPLPPLAVQEEIVRILDSFTELTSELTSELTMRKQQYEYYRDSFFKNNIPNKKLKDIVDIYLGLTYKPTYVENGIKFISSQNISNDYLDLSNIKYISQEEYNKTTQNAKPKRGDILFTRVGSNLGHPVIVDVDFELCIFVSLGYLRIKNKKQILNSYIKYWMNTEQFWEQVRKNVHGSAKVNLNTGWLKEFDIFIPPLEEQQRIVDVLDRFDTLVNDIKTGLPAEIEARKQQYEYYRDKLLTFKKLEV